MSISEFDIISRFFTRKTYLQSSTQLGIGDDCALLSIPDGYQLAVTTDTMVENIHFFPDIKPAYLGYKLLAVNLSDLAAMGAKPIAVTLALTLPTVNEQWLTGFARGFFELADRYQLDLIGGDTTAGPLTLTVQAMGLVPNNKAIRRTGAKPGDEIYITGSVGDAGLALKIINGEYQAQSSSALERFHQPQPRVAEGILLRGIASACVDISDGLLADLGHILNSSDCGATLDWEHINLSSAVRLYLSQNEHWMMPLTSGEDYELCFTVPAHKEAALTTKLAHFNYQKIGTIDAQHGLRIKKDKQTSTLNTTGYQHFS